MHKWDVTMAPLFNLDQILVLTSACTTFILQDKLNTHCNIMLFGFSSSQLWAMSIKKPSFDCLVATKWAIGPKHWYPDGAQYQCFIK